MIPISKPSIEQSEIEYIMEAVSSGWISSIGPYIDEFEKEFARYCGVKHCVATSNGTVAIHLALMVLGIGKGDEVIIPDFTFAATANAVILSGATPVYADICADSWCIDPKSVLSKITPKTKAIIPVHIYGHPCDMESLNEIAKKYSLNIIEDAAEAHGATYKNQFVGSFGDCATFSFFGNKIITTGEGGCITTNSDSIAEKARILRDHGMSKEKRYWHIEVGYNYRMTNLQAAIGVSQLKRIENFLSSRKEILEMYQYYLKEAGFTFNPCVKFAKPVNWLTCILLHNKFPIRRDDVLIQLRKKGVDSRPFFYPLTSMPPYISQEEVVNPTTENISSRGLNIPTFPGMTENEIMYVSKSILELEYCF